VKILITVVFGLVSLQVQGLIVHDPAHMAKTLEVLKQHAKTVNQLKAQYKMLEREFEQLQNINTVLGNPKEALKDAAYQFWNYERVDTFNNEEEIWGKLKRGLSGLESLGFEGNGLYKRIKQKDRNGKNIKRNFSNYQRHAAIEERYLQLQTVNKRAEQREDELQKEAGRLLQKLKYAITDAEVQKLGTQINAVNAQFGLINNMRQAELGKLQAQDILNRNQREKEKKAAIEEWIHKDKKETLHNIRFLKRFGEQLRIK